MKNTTQGYKESLTYNASSEIFGRAKALRKSMTEAERLLWEILRDRKSFKKFRRQHPIKRFIVDFYCHEHKLVVELDGGIHDKEEVSERDKGRTVELEKLGLRVIRFKNEEVKKDIKAVVRKILDYMCN